MVIFSLKYRLRKDQIYIDKQRDRYIEEFPISSVKEKPHSKEKMM